MNIEQTAVEQAKVDFTVVTTAKPLLSAYELSKAGRHAEAIAAYKAQIEANPAWMKSYTSLGWEVYRRLREIEKDPAQTAEVRSLLELGPLCAKGTQGVLLSCLMRQTTACVKVRMTENGHLPSNLGRTYLAFIEALDVNHFSEQDKTPYKPSPDKEFPSLCEIVAGVVHKVVKSLLKNANMDMDSETLEVVRHQFTWIIPFFARCAGEFPRNIWMAYYHAHALIAAGRQAEAQESMLKLVIAKPQEFWAWDVLAETFSGCQEKMLACYCKSLTCPSPREYTINVHRKLGRLLQTMGFTKESALEDAEIRSIKGFVIEHAPGADNRALYERYAHAAMAILQAYQTEGKETRPFEGQFWQRDEQPFGFVDQIFIPPPLLKSLGRPAPGTMLRGTAVKDWDQRKQCEGWKAISVERIPEGLPF